MKIPHNTGETGYRMQSLSFVRQMLGLEAVYPNAKAACQATTVTRLATGQVPPIGAVVWFVGHPMYGDCALSVGGGRILAVSMSGEPQVTWLDDYANARRTKVIGWSMGIGPVKVREPVSA